MDEFGRTVRYLFILAFVLIVVAYYAGSTQVLGSLFSGTTALDYAVTGRNAQGAFAAYPTGGPTGAAGG